MKCCPHCHTLYDASLPVCPKCGVDDVPQDEAFFRSAGREEVRRSWLMLLVAIPSLILLICILCGGIVRLIQS